MSYHQSIDTFYLPHDDIKLSLATPLTPNHPILPNLTPLTAPPPPQTPPFPPPPPPRPPPPPQMTRHFVHTLCSLLLEEVQHGGRHYRDFQQKDAWIEVGVAWIEVGVIKSHSTNIQHGQCISLITLLTEWLHGSWPVCLIASGSSTDLFSLVWIFSFIYYIKQFNRAEFHRAAFLKLKILLKNFLLSRNKQDTINKLYQQFGW